MTDRNGAALLALARHVDAIEEFGSDDGAARLLGRSWLGLDTKFRLTNFVATVGNLRYPEWPSDLERVRLWYEPQLDRIHEDSEVRRVDLVQPSR